MTASLFTSAKLPFSVMTLTQLAAVNIAGNDAKTYLQGQVTVDVMTLHTDHYSFAGHCDAKGKLWGNFLLFPTENGLTYLEQRSILETQMTELKKYAVFSKITISPDESTVILGVAGQHARTHLSTYFSQLPSKEKTVLADSHTTILWLPLPEERFIVLTSAEEATRFNAHFADAICTNSAQWDVLDIEAGYPILSSRTSGEYLPQAVNLHALGGINFKKGCYVGQEMVARAKFRGANKRAMFCLTGSAGNLPNIGEGIDMQLGDKWRETGTVLAAVKLSDQTILVQIIMNMETDPKTLFRVKRDEQSRLTICSLPYSLDES